MKKNEHKREEDECKRVKDHEDQCKKDHDKEEERKKKHEEKPECGCHGKKATSNNGKDHKGP